MEPELVTGIAGQDGSYLTELLLAEGVEVHGVIRRASGFGIARIGHLYRDPHEAGVRLHLHNVDLTDSSQLPRLISEIANWDLPPDSTHGGTQLRPLDGPEC